MWGHNFFSSEQVNVYSVEIVSEVRKINNRATAALLSSQYDEIHRKDSAPQVMKCTWPSTQHHKA